MCLHLKLFLGFSVHGVSLVCFQPSQNLKINAFLLTFKALMSALYSLATAGCILLFWRYLLDLWYLISLVSTYTFFCQAGKLEAQNAVDVTEMDASGLQHMLKWGAEVLDWMLKGVLAGPHGKSVMKGLPRVLLCTQRCCVGVMSNSQGAVSVNHSQGIGVCVRIHQNTWLFLIHV